MKNDNLKKIRVLILFSTLVLIIIIFRGYINIINKYRNQRIFALKSEKYANEVNNPVFKIDKIIIYSDANIEDLSKNKDLSNINISQFTDFAIYIDNRVKFKELAYENTINKISIDNIGITALENSGIQKFSSKKIDELGKYIKIDNSFKEINYDVIHKNSEKNLFNDSKCFYTDCSEPLILSYVNENIVKGKNISESREKLSLDGTLLKYIKFDLNKLNYKISFTVNIENNLGEKYYCNCALDVNLGAGNENGIYSGYIMQIFDLTNNDLRFRKL